MTAVMAPHHDGSGGHRYDIDGSWCHLGVTWVERRPFQSRPSVATRAVAACRGGACCSTAAAAGWPPLAPVRSCDRLAMALKDNRLPAHVTSRSSCAASDATSACRGCHPNSGGSGRERMTSKGLTGDGMGGEP